MACDPEKTSGFSVLWHPDASLTVESYLDLTVSAIAILFLAANVHAGLAGSGVLLHNHVGTQKHHVLIPDPALSDQVAVRIKSCRLYISSSDCDAVVGSLHRRVLVVTENLGTDDRRVARAGNRTCTPCVIAGRSADPVRRTRPSFIQVLGVHYARIEHAECSHQQRQPQQVQVL